MITLVLCSVKNLTLTYLKKMINVTETKREVRDTGDTAKRRETREKLTEFHLHVNK